MIVIYIILAILGIVLGFLVLAALFYAFIVFSHSHRDARLKSDKYDMYNDEREKTRIE